MKNLTFFAEKAAKPEFLQLWAGQSAHLSSQSDAKTLLQTLISGFLHSPDRFTRTSNRMADDHGQPER
jgi:hypothetical protein